MLRWCRQLWSLQYLHPLRPRSHPRQTQLKRRRKFLLQSGDVCLHPSNRRVVDRNLNAKRGNTWRPLPTVCCCSSNFNCSSMPSLKGISHSLSSVEPSEGKELGKKASRCDEDSSFVPSTLKSGVDQASMHSLQRAQRDRTQPLLQPQASYASSWAQEDHNTLSAENRISVPFYEDGSPCNMVEERGDHFSRTSPGDDTLPRCIGVGQEAGEYSTNSVFGLTRAPAADYGSRPSPPTFKLEFQSAQQYSWSDRDSGSRMRDEAGSISRAFQPTSSLLLERRASIDERPESPTSAYDGGRSPSLTPPPQGSVSSQDSITVPPPADWHKNLAKRSRDPVGDYSGMSLSPHAAMLNREASTSHSSPTVTHIQERKVSWSMAPRTERILCEISNRAAHPDRSLMTPSTKLRMRCVKKEDVAAYMFTLLQCYRINERLQQEPVPCSTTAEFKARSSS